MSIQVLAQGPYACFTRPELSVERYTYDVITPSAAAGMLNAIYGKPAIQWIIERIHVLNPIRLASIKRNEVAVAGHYDGRQISATGNRMQRSSVVLQDVAYVISFHAQPTGKASDEDRAKGIDIRIKHESMMRRRLERGQHYYQPVLGCREWPADVQLIDEAPPSELKGERDFGLMLHTINYATRERYFWRPMMCDGIIDVPSIESPDVISAGRA